MKTRRKRPEIVKTQTVAAAIRRKEWICLIIALLFAFPSSGNAQCEAKNDAFKSGEHVMYELYFNWKFIWKKVGLASLTTNSTTYHSEPAYRVNLLAISSKEADFFFKMRDTLTSVMTEKLEPRYFRKGAEEGKRYTVDEARFSFREGMCYVNQKRVRKDGSTPRQSKVTIVVSMICLLFWRRPVRSIQRNIPSVNVSSSRWRRGVE